MDHNEERKPSADDDPRKPPPAGPMRVLDQVHADFVVAMALHHHQETRSAGNFRILPSIESDEEDLDDDDDSTEFGDNDYEFFEMEFGEAQDSNSEFEEEEMMMMMEEDEIDPDELSYEELIALGELIGEEKRGLPEKEISKCLKDCRFDEEKKKEMEKCVICQLEYEEGEELVGLRSCEHLYHSECIIKWLQVRRICPICTSEIPLSSSEQQKL